MPLAPVERHVPERARGVVAGGRLDLTPARRLDHAATGAPPRPRRRRRAGRRPARRGPRRPSPVKRHGVAVDRRARRRRARLPARASTVQPSIEVAGRARGQPRRAQLARGDGLERLVAGGLQQRGGGQQPEQRRAGQHAAALLGHEHRVEGAEARRRRGPRRPAARASRPRPAVGQRSGSSPPSSASRAASTVFTRDSAPRAASRRNSCSSDSARFMRPRPPSPWRAAR